MALASDSQCLGFWKSHLVFSLMNLSVTSSKIDFKLIFSLLFFHKLYVLRQRMPRSHLNRENFKVKKDILEN